MIEDVYEPLPLYRDRLKTEYADNTSAFFEELVRSAAVDEDANRATVAAIRALEKEIADGSSSSSRWQFLRVVVVLFLVVSGLIVAVFLGHLAWPASFGNPGPLWFVGCLATVVGTILLLVKKLNPTIRALTRRLADLKEQLAARMREAWAQLDPLNRLYDWGMIARLIQKTVPRLAIDPYFSSARLRELRESFGLNDEFNRGKSVLFAQSGELNGNPFVLAETLDFEWGSETYHGSLVITWEEQETYTDSDGKTRTRWVTRTQTLHASVTKPKPAYSRQKFVIFGNEAAADLCFSRTPSDLSGAGGGLLDKWRMKRAIGQLEKRSRDLEKGNGFTVMANREFDALFRATNRDHEVQFRVLFTPLAQQQMVALLKDKAIGYGDDFTFVKSHKINVVQPAHLASLDITAAPDLFKNYELAEARRFFSTYSNDYFRHFFFAIAPILTIPIYQQHRSDADIYKDVYGRAACFWEYESIANHYGQAAFRHPASITENILKTSASNPGEVEVTAHGFRGEDRIDYVSMLGGDGAWHNVPVPWIEYLPVSRTRSVAVRETEGLTRQDFDRQAKHSSEWQTFFRAHSTDSARVLFRHSIASVLKD